MSTGSPQIDDRTTPLVSAGQNNQTAKGVTTSMVHAVAWQGAATWATQFVTWGYTIIVARKLTPSDYGLIGMATILIELLTVMGDFGVGLAIILTPDPNKDEVSQLNTVAVISGVALFLTSCLAAYPLGRFFRAPDLPPVIIALSLGLVVVAFKTVPDALLNREFRFKLLAHIQAAQVIVYGIIAVASVLLGAGYWSLVLANLSGITVCTFLVLLYRPHPFAWPKIAALRRSLVFSSQIMGRRIAWYCNSNADFAVAGRVLGKAALGSYNIAWTISSQPLQKFTDLVTRVVPPYFSKAQRDSAMLRDYVLTITQAISMVTLPVTLGLALVADDLIVAALGPKWIAAVLPLRILALYAALRSISGFFAPLLNATGQSRFVMWNHILAAVYCTLGFYVGSRWGIVGIAFIWPLLYPFAAIPLCVRMLRQINLPVRSYLASLSAGLSGSLIMVVGVLLLKNALPVHAAYLRLGIQVIAGATIYCVAVAGLHPAQARRWFGLIRRATQTGSIREAPATSG